MFQKKVKSNKEQMVVMNTRINQTMLGLGTWKEKLKVFLRRLLKLGSDSRSGGVTWLIDRLWALGEKVELEQLPEFLDEKAKVFLLTKHQMEM